MLSKRTIIGLLAGILIIGIGGVSLIQHIGVHTDDDFHDVIEVGAPERYRIPAPNSSPQTMIITGDSFDLKLSSPGVGLQIPSIDSEKTKESYKNEKILEWTHLEDGETIIQIQNTGNTELEITGVITTSYKPEIITLDFMVLITGVLVIGFSMGFTLRKPKGF